MAGAGPCERGQELSSARSVDGQSLGKPPEDRELARAGETAHARVRKCSCWEAVARMGPLSVKILVRGREGAGSFVPPGHRVQGQRGQMLQPPVVPLWARKPSRHLFLGELPE